MLTLNDITPTPLTGQFWAATNPLSLLRVDLGCPNETYTFTQWLSGHDSEFEMFWMPPLSKDFKFLRWSYPYSNSMIADDLEIEAFKARTGDVFEVANGMLAFAVLENGIVNLYSDAKMPEATILIHSVVQRGPGLPLDKSVKSRYERIIDEANSHLSLVRPVGRGFLRQEKKNSVLLPGSNPRPKDRVITNIKLLRSYRRPL